MRLVPASRRAVPASAAIVLVALLGAVLAACGGADPDATTATAAPAATTVATAIAPPTVDQETTADDAAIDHDRGAATVILRLASGGGDVPMEIAFTEVAPLVITGDGRVLRISASESFDPHRAIQPYEQLQLDDAGMQALLAAADRAGLLGTDIDYGQPGVTDSPTTTLTLTTAAGTSVHAASALGYADGAADTGLTEPQQASRRALLSFLHSLEDLQGIAGGGVTVIGPYTPDRVALQGIAVAADVPAGGTGTWPVDRIEAPAPDACVEVTGDAAGEAATLLAGASAGSITVWTAGNRTVRIVGRMVAPGETGCASSGG